MAKATANLDWLEKAQQTLNEDPAFRKLGSADVVLGTDVGDEARLVTFEAFEVTDTSVVQRAGLRDAEIVIQMSPRNWNAWLRRRAKGNGPTLLSLDLEDGVVSSSSPLGKLKLERYNLTLQAFIDEGGRIAA